MVSCSLFRETDPLKSICPGQTERPSAPITRRNDDVAQKSVIIWIMMLLVAYGNNAPFVNDAPHEAAALAGEGGATSGEAAAEAVGHAARSLLSAVIKRAAPATTEEAATAEGSAHHAEGGGRTTAIVLYIVMASTLYLARFIYSFYIPQYRGQFRLQTLSFLVPLGLYIGAIFTSVRAAIALVLVGVIFEYLAWTVIFSPHFKKYFKWKYSSALNSASALSHSVFYKVTGRTNG